MTIIFNKDIAVERIQLQEIIDTVCDKPDMGWNYDSETGKTEDCQSYRLQGDFGTYTYFVRLSTNTIYILDVQR